MAVRAPTTREHKHLIARRSPGVEIDAPVHQGTDDQGGVRRRALVVQARGDEVEFLAEGAVARLEGDGDEVFAEVAGGYVDGEAGAGRGF